VEIIYNSLLTLLTTSWLNVAIMLVAYLKFSANLRSWVCASLCLCAAGSSLTDSPGLANTLASVHPLAVLTCYGVLLSSHNLSSKKNLPVSAVKVLIVSLTLGGYWAFQEFTWGGWWNWDGVEVPALLAVIVYVIYLMHSVMRIGKSVRSANTIKPALTLIIVILVTRYEMVSVHAFVSLSTTYNPYISPIVALPKWVFLAWIVVAVYAVKSFISLQLTAWVVIAGLSPLLLNLVLSGVKSRSTHSWLYLLMCGCLWLNIKLVDIITISNLGSTYWPCVPYHLNLWVKPITNYYSGQFQHLSSLIN
jgi:hypothetical protein